MLEPNNLTCLLGTMTEIQESSANAQRSCDALCSPSDHAHPREIPSESNEPCFRDEADNRNPRTLRKPRMAQVGFQVNCRKTALELLERCKQEELERDGRERDHQFLCAEHVHGNNSMTRNVAVSC